MAGGKPAVSFDEIIQASRARRKNEQLANEIFGRNKKNNNNKDDSDRNNRSSSRTPSLASRMGVQKRSTSSTSVNSRPQPPSRPSSTSLASRSSRLQTAIDSPNTSQANISKSRGISIKGAAGPFTVVATNFAPGTTAADIESAVANDSTDSEGHNGLLSCTLASGHQDSAVAADLVYSERTIAERVISLYNNQRADGRLLKLSLKPTSTRNPLVPAPQPTTSSAPEDDDTDMTSSDPAPTDQYNSSRSNEEAARTRSNEHRRADPDLTDGRYGFSSSSRPNEPEASPAHENGSRRDGDGERERERERSRSRSKDRDRDRDRDRERDRDDRRYDERDSRRHEERRESYRDDRDRRSYDSRPPYEPPRGGRQSHYGNGVGGPRGGFGGYNAPGRGGMWNDRMGPRGGMGPGGGGFGRGGYGRGRW